MRPAACGGVALQAEGKPDVNPRHIRLAFFIPVPEKNGPFADGIPRAACNLLHAVQKNLRPMQKNLEAV